MSGYSKERRKEILSRRIDFRHQRYIWKLSANQKGLNDMAAPGWSNDQIGTRILHKSEHPITIVNYPETLSDDDPTGNKSIIGKMECNNLAETHHDELILLDVAINQAQQTQNDDENRYIKALEAEWLRATVEPPEPPDSVESVLVPSGTTLKNNNSTSPAVSNIADILHHHSSNTTATRPFLSVMPNTPMACTVIQPDATTMACAEKDLYQQLYTFITFSRSKQSVDAMQNQVETLFKAGLQNLSHRNFHFLIKVLVILLDRPQADNPTAVFISARYRTVLMFYIKCHLHACVALPEEFLPVLQLATLLRQYNIQQDLPVADIFQVNHSLKHLYTPEIEAECQYLLRAI